MPFSAPRVSRANRIAMWSPFASSLFASSLLAAVLLASVLLASSLSGCGADATTADGEPQPVPDGVITVSIATLNTTELGEPASFVVSLDSAPVADVLIGIEVSDPSEGLVVAPGADVEAASRQFTLLFSPEDWESPREIAVVAQDDGFADGDQTYTISIGPTVSNDARYDGQDPADVEVTNNDIDTPGVTVLVETPLMMSEDRGREAFSIVLDIQPTETVTIEVNSADITEVEVSGGTSDDPAESLSVAFNARNWDVPQTVQLWAVDDTDVDGNQTVTIQISDAVSEDPAFSGFGLDDVEVTVIDDEVAGVTVVPTHGLILTEAGASQTFEVVLTEQPTAEVSIPVESTDTSEALVHTGSDVPASSLTLTFSSSSYDTPQTVTVTGVDDGIVDGDQAFDITVGPLASESDLFDGIDPPNVRVVTVDDDLPGVTVSPTMGLMVTEDGATDTFTVVLDTEPSADVAVRVTSGDVNEIWVRGGDRPETFGPSATLTFTDEDWSTRQTITVQAVDDVSVDGTRIVDVIVWSTQSEDFFYNRIDPADVSVTSADNDAPGVIVVEPETFVVSENGDSVTFSVRLATRPDRSVRILMRSTNSAEIRLRRENSTSELSQTTLYFDDDDWNTPQLIEVVGRNDDYADGPQTADIQLGPTSSSDANYGQIELPTWEFTNNDNDIADIAIIGAEDIVVAEGSTEGATFGVQLTSRPAGSVTVTVSTDDDTEALLLDGDSPSTSVDLFFQSWQWANVMTVTVVSADDDLLDGAVDFTLSVSTSSADDKYDPLTDIVSGITQDDDLVTVRLEGESYTTELGDVTSLDVFLAQVPSATVTVTLTVSHPAEALLADADEMDVDVLTLVFEPGDFDTVQTVTVIGQSDAEVDGDTEYFITTTISSSDTLYADAATETLWFRNLDLADQGTEEVPLAHDPETDIGRVTDGGSSFYSLEGPDSSYLLNITSLDGSDFTVTVSDALPASGGTIYCEDEASTSGDVSCAVNPPVSVVYLEVNGTDGPAFFWAEPLQ